MLNRDFAYFLFQSVVARRLRTLLTLTGIAVGIAAVVLLTSLGVGVQRYVLAEFTQFGTNLLVVTPGKTTTFGLSGAVISTVRPLTLEDAQWLEGLPDVQAVVPLVQGNGAVEFEARERRTTILGVGADLPRVWNFNVTLGRFLPPDDLLAARSYAILGNTVREELFGTRNPLGARIRVGGERYRVLGVMAPKGQVLGFDLDDAVYLPVSRAMSLFDRDGLMEVDVLYRDGVDDGVISARITSRLKRRHGQEDFTVTTQAQMLEVLGSVLEVLTLSVAALGGISLLVGGVGILTIMTIAVSERTGEIGLLRALGATRRQIHRLFLGEAVILGLLGGLAGVGIGWVGALLVHLLFPAVPAQTPLFYLLSALGLAVGIGAMAGFAPARRAAAMDPVEALRTE